jgi:hypothetical protein
MTIRCLLIESDPPMQIHGADALPYIDPAVRAEQILVRFGPFRSDTAGEIPNVVAVLRNADGEATDAVVDPPIAARAVVYVRDGDATVEEFVGVVESVHLELTPDGSTIEIRA